MRASPCRMRGFTLIELLVAIAIFAFLATAMYGGTQWIIDEREIVTERATELNRLLRAVRLMHNDFIQAYPRSVRDELGRGQVAALLTDRSAGLSIRLTRNGWRNPEARGNRGHFQRVQYRYEDDTATLYRDTWPVLDRVLGVEPREEALLEDVVEFEVEFLDDSGNWLQNWPADDNVILTTMPRALRYRLETESYGVVERLVEIPG